MHYIQIRFKTSLCQSQSEPQIAEQDANDYSRAGKPSKPWIAERDANGNLSFIHRLQVVSVPLLTGDIIGAGKPIQPRIAERDANVSFLHCFRVVSVPVLTSCKPL